MKDDIPKQSKKKQKAKTVQIRWIAIIFLSTVLISGLFSTVSNQLLSGANMVAAFGILLVIVLIGILFDVIGVAVTAADPKPFHAMAAHRVRGAREALNMLRRADRVSSFCNDVIGDICGVVSGTASASIAALAVLHRNGQGLGIMEILLAALVSGLTVGGKAIGKTIAMNRSTQIVHTAAVVVYYVKYMPKAVSGLFHKHK